MRRTWSAVGACAGLAAALALAVPAIAASSTTMKVGVGLNPYKLGAPTHITFRVTNVTADGSLPQPLTQIVGLIGAPASAVDVRGFPTCDAAVLQQKGPSGCPRASLGGRGTANLGAVIGGTTISEPATLTAFLAKTQPGDLATLNIYGNGTAPISEQLVFPLHIQRGSGPYGIKLVSDVPTIPTVPGGPDASTISFNITLGGSRRVRVTKRVHKHGRTVKRKVTMIDTGITLPKACPRGGFKGVGQETFADNSQTSTNVTVPCP